MRALTLGVLLLGVPALAGAQAVTTTTVVTTTAAPPATDTPPPSPELMAADREGVRGRLAVYADPLARKGWLPAPGLDRTLGTMAPGAVARFAVPLVAGYTYRVIGTCGRECSNLDVALSSPSGEAVASDRRADGIPIVAFRAPATGTYAVNVRMATCNIGACTYGVAMYASPRGR